jgi:hypothetical protein
MRIRPLAIILACALAPTAAFAQASDVVERPAARIADGLPAIPAAMAAETRPYMEFRTAGFAGWNAADRSMLISTRFGNTAQIGYCADGDVRQGNADLTALPGLFAPANGGQHGKCSIGAADDIPSRQNMVDGFGTRPSHHGITNGIIHGIIKGWRTVGPAHHPHGDKISASFP